jgi:hypothetical protein
MRETRSSGSVEGVMRNRDPYSDYLLRFERVDNLGAYRIPSEIGLLIPSVYPYRFRVLKSNPRVNCYE